MDDVKPLTAEEALEEARNQGMKAARCDSDDLQMPELALAHRRAAATLRAYAEQLSTIDNLRGELAVANDRAADYRRMIEDERADVELSTSRPRRSPFVRSEARTMRAARRRDRARRRRRGRRADHKESLRMVAQGSRDVLDREMTTTEERLERAERIQLLTQEVRAYEARVRLTATELNFLIEGDRADDGHDGEVCLANAYVVRDLSRDEIEIPTTGD